MTTPNHEDAIQDVYSRVPEIHCKGLCHPACTTILMADAEHARCAAKHGSSPAWTPDVPIATPCPWLTNDKRCQHHQNRPLVCRLYGVAKGLPCPFGCKPTVPLPDKAAFQLMDRLLALTTEAPDAKSDP